MQRRSARSRVALYQHDLTGRPLVGDACGPRHSLLRPRARRTRRPIAHEELDAIIDRHAHGWSVQRIQPLERSIMRVALVEMLHPDDAPGEQPIPPEGAIEEAVESAKTFCGARGARLRQRRARRGPARGARECAPAA